MKNKLFSSFSCFTMLLLSIVLLGIASLGCSDDSAAITVNGNGLINNTQVVVELVSNEDFGSKTITSQKLSDTFNQKLKVDDTYAVSISDPSNNKCVLSPNSNGSITADGLNTPLNVTVLLTCNTPYHANVQVNGLNSGGESGSLEFGISVNSTNQPADVLTFNTNTPAQQFSTVLYGADAYNITMTPINFAANQTCAVATNSNSLVSTITQDADINIVVNCVTTHTVGIQVNGLNSGGQSGSLSFIMTTNVNDTLDFTSSGTQIFPSNLLTGSTYTITLTSSNLGDQTCTLNSSAGTMSNADVLLVVTCTTDAVPVQDYTLSVTANGLVNDFIEYNITINGILLSTDTAYLTPGTPTQPFDTQLNAGDTYSINVSTNGLIGQSCSPTTSSGTMPASDQTVTVTCTSASAIVLFSAGSQTSGNLGIRNTSDALCQTAANALPLSCSSVRAFISYNSEDQISDMPTLYNVPTNLPIVSRLFTSTDICNQGSLPDSAYCIAHDWSDLMDGTIRNSLKTAQVTTVTSGYGATSWWSGSNSDGNINANTCNEWTSSSAAMDGEIGSGDYTSAWISVYTVNCAGGGYPYTNPELLCLCY